MGFCLAKQDQSENLKLVCDNGRQNVLEALASISIGYKTLNNFKNIVNYFYKFIDL